jgi:hypothetical protein
MTRKWFHLTKLIKFPRLVSVHSMYQRQVVSLDVHSPAFQLNWLEQGGRISSSISAESTVPLSYYWSSPLIVHEKPHCGVSCLHSLTHSLTLLLHSYSGPVMSVTSTHTYMCNSVNSSLVSDDLLNCVCE